MCAAPLLYQGCTQCILYQVYRLLIKEGNFNLHPNVLPVIGVSETPYLLCIMSPWMSGGNIAQYIRMNPSADRLALVCVHRPES